MLLKNIQDIIEPTIKVLGFELWGCDLRQDGTHSLLRVYIEKRGEGGVSLDDCMAVSREIGALLDVEDPIKNPHQLEVSSPGLERTLFTSSHFERYIGHEVKVKLRMPQSGRRNFSAVIEKVVGSDIFLHVENETICVTLSDIQKAKLIVR